MPILTFDDKAKVPAGFEDIIKEDGGKFTINVVAKVKLDEFRDKNVELSKERDTLKDNIAGYVKVVGEDLSEFTDSLTELRTTAQDVKDGKLKGSKAVDEAVESRLVERVSAMKTDHEAQLAELVTKNTALTASVSDGKAKFDKTVVDKFITDAVLDPESGVSVHALSDILARARNIYKVNEDDEVVPLKSDGKTVIYGADGATAMSANEWVQGLQKTAPHFFTSNTGGDAQGADKGKYPNGMNQEEFNKLPASQRLEFANSKKAA